MKIITEQDIRLLAWAQQQLDVKWNPSECRWLAGIESDALVFVVIYSRFSERNCELTIATDKTKRWATKENLRSIFTPPFEQWKLRRVTFIVKSDNKASLKMMRPLGAVREGIIRQAFTNKVDGIIFGMLREECRWIS